MPDKNSDLIRLDYKVILEMIENKSRVLDLGCGDGHLLQLLKNKKSCSVTGIEIDEKEIYKCVEKGISVSHDDIDSSLSDFGDKRFDYIILNESLQQVLNPKNVILESLRISKKVIVGIPNFCYFMARFQIFFQGRVPVTKELPYQWFDTPNLRFLSLKDFINFCKANNIKILDKVGISNNKIVHVKRNFFANLGIFLLEK
ncbi:MAG: methionine biosynthesis protein MetW [Omnitrophica WOR_2 bacterium GWF2_38_59]|nr:MAG: methionine biosynthesis protein MetW [Omnitrophica WOR_2 bacterium GWF2_38_59]OGX49579.1 MAG: methionine biosynthesis protein MetW [Omnitrophica WOR_2 bacterium RIFOXYA2_FULL_38_17]OGX55260.1 MAG: methionine biosynthesis protein MetW [Omnitrophica WOR_2 bacterium RIFOXYB2_FULL_38_16]OGX59736.1 MAG: methionine biosynthesis protein MetW [Omnitrophica WOR_2 bacterium RIFOXYC2_FULL_38_12]HBG61613.1 methionine biosynthesis protein MetW [Candidatus Omnitrophota bacterium]